MFVCDTCGLRTNDRRLKVIHFHQDNYTPGGMRDLGDGVAYQAPTPDEFRSWVSAIDKQYGQDERHRAFDLLVWEILKNIGYNEGVRIIEDSPKWYS